MGRLKWVKRDPNAALTETAGLTLEERGAYETVLNLIYAGDGKVDDDPRFLAGWMRCDVRVWKRIRARLIALEKLYVNGDTLRSSSADDEVSKALARITSAQEAGLRSASSRDTERKILKGLGSTGVGASVQQTHSNNTSRSTATSSEYVAARGEEAFRTKGPAELSRADLQASYAARRAGRHGPTSIMAAVDRLVSEFDNSDQDQGRVITLAPHDTG